MGRDPRAAFARVRTYYDQLIALQPKNWSAHSLRTRIALGEARSGAATAIVDGRAALARAIEANDHLSKNHVFAAELALLEASDAEKRNADATAALDQALAESRRALALDAQDAEAVVVGARAYVRLAQSKHGPARQALVAAGLVLVDASLARAGDDAEAHLVRAQLLGLEESADAQQPSDQAAQRAFAINPLLPKEWRLR